MAYVDTELGPTPKQIGQIQGTPTIKDFVPKRGNKMNEKAAIDYDQAREVDAFIRFATDRMPNYVKKIDGDEAMKKFDSNAKYWGLPRLLVFSDKTSTNSTLKALSAEYRRRIVIGELKPKSDRDTATRKYDGADPSRDLGIVSFPSALCIDIHGVRSIFENKEMTYRRLDTFVRRCAVAMPVFISAAEREKKQKEADKGNAYGASHGNEYKKDEL